MYCGFILCAYCFSLGIGGRGGGGGGGAGFIE